MWHVKLSLRKENITIGKYIDANWQELTSRLMFATYAWTPQITACG